jgi:hypothetical protein
LFSSRIPNSTHFVFSPWCHPDSKTLLYFLSWFLFFSNTKQHPPLSSSLSSSLLLHRTSSIQGRVRFELTGREASGVQDQPIQPLWHLPLVSPRWWRICISLLHRIFFNLFVIFKQHPFVFSLWCHPELKTSLHFLLVFFFSNTKQHPFSIFSMVPPWFEDISPFSSWFYFLL